MSAREDMALIIAAVADRLRMVPRPDIPEVLTLTRATMPRQKPREPDRRFAGRLARWSVYMADCYPLQTPAFMRLHGLAQRWALDDPDAGEEVERACEALLRELAR